VAARFAVINPIPELAPVITITWRSADSAR
jgi:hypothetical protein